VIAFLLTLYRFLRVITLSIKDPEFQALFFLVFTSLLSGTVFYSNVEGWSLLDSLYFSVVTLATVGYGDLAPTTSFGKAFTIFYILLGVGLIAAFLAKIASRSVEIRASNRKKRHPREGSAGETSHPDEARKDGPA
jgi:voltage-gated potassium channel